MEPKTEKEWRVCLSPEEYRILRQKGTEMPFTGKYVRNKNKGMYVCAGCGNKLFSSESKYDSGTGWPSFFEPVSGSVEEKPDNSLFMKRTEILCKKCRGHLGHVFDDGPKTIRRTIGTSVPAATGKRFCINSGALNFKEEAGKKKIKLQLE